MTDGMPTMIHVCKIDETQQGDSLLSENGVKALGSVISQISKKRRRRKAPSLRVECLSLWSIVKMSQYLTMNYKRHNIRSLDLMLHYGTKIVRSRRRRVQMNVPQMIEDWKNLVVTLSTAHDKADVDAAEYKMDELLQPILSAPVSQLREFYSGLTAALRADPKVPFFLWSVFNDWGRAVLDKCEDKESAKRLRKKLAEEIAEMVEPEVQTDIVSAIKGALMWRPSDTLKEIKDDLESGRARPRLRGKESCLFLVTEEKVRRGKRGQPTKGKPRELHTVML